MAQELQIPATHLFPVEGHPSHAGKLMMLPPTRDDAIEGEAHVCAAVAAAAAEDLDHLLPRFASPLYLTADLFWFHTGNLRFN